MLLRRFICLLVVKLPLISVYIVCGDSNTFCFYVTQQHSNDKNLIQKHIIHLGLPLFYVSYMIFRILFTNKPTYN